jgi:hypothetical protein
VALEQFAELLCDPREIAESLQPAFQKFIVVEKLIRPLLYPFFDT